MHELNEHDSVHSEAVSDHDGAQDKERKPKFYPIDDNTPGIQGTSVKSHYKRQNLKDNSDQKNGECMKTWSLTDDGAAPKKKQRKGIVYQTKAKVRYLWIICIA